MAFELLSCAAIVLSVTQYIPMEPQDISPTYKEKCSKQNCYVLSNEELLSSLTRANRAGRKQTLDSLKRGDLEKKLTNMEKEVAECRAELQHESIYGIGR